ncbi:MAG: tRNA pseudouridine55 synthase [Petroclostridium sp.]|uniref:tRNA pseudouridine(55) synthase TruB n=1 Tax=Petroclostridium xylanilyticum TaxID=1792311 RepID=UPI000B97F269|nr:tRNA pseudouridine(55) synthase TruB [Petroclostridium xylanilyticum]MBZ4645912.1 tRNA pseudouridine synthase [Clostridia bacterium]MDK2810173.1 tRNA pseudouridine55 synthase [Petroclostridium sp.]
MDGVINILKPSGMTSHDVVSFIRKCTHIKKVGHTGTLDPGAAGVLPICIGKATKVADMLSGQDKQYRAELKLGITTDTQDSFGQIISEQKVIISREIIEESVYSFKGTIEQVPPMYSAIKVKGQKLYELARKGVEVKREPRQIKIYDIKVLNIDFDNNTVLLDVQCSKGTYIRTLCFDIGEKIGCGAHMSFLLRTRSGNFTLDQAITIEELERCAKENKLNNLLTPVDKLFCDFPFITVNSNVEKKIVNGNQVSVDLIENKSGLRKGTICRIYNGRGVFLCLSQVVQKLDNGLYLKLLKSFF